MFLYDEQIAAQPAAVLAVLQRPAPPRLDPTRPVIFAGQGTSLNACRVAAEWLPSARAVEAHDLARRLPISAADQVVAVSHGGKGFTQEVLEKARQAGARTFAVVGEGAPGPRADFVVRTCPQERAGTHTVSYLTALAALGRMAGLDALLQAVPALLQATLATPAPVEAAARIARRDPVLVAGFGLDAITAAEAALKLKEATFAWAEGMSVEQALHGPAIALREGMGAILISPAGDDGGRTRRLAQACAALGVVTLSCGSAGENLRFPSCDERVRPLVSAVPLQRLAAEVARIAGGDPDRTRLDTEPWKSALRR